MTKACLKTLYFEASRTNSFAQLRQVTALGPNAQDMEAHRGRPPSRDIDHGLSGLQSTSTIKVSRTKAGLGAGSHHSESCDFLSSSSAEESNSFNNYNSPDKHQQSLLNHSSNNLATFPSFKSSSSHSRLSDRSHSTSRPQSRLRSRESFSAGPVWRSKRQRSDKGAPIQDFHEYATLFWATHYQTCQKQDSEYCDQALALVEQLLLHSNVQLDNSNFNLWVRSVQRLLSERPFGFYDKMVETQLQDCITPPPTAFQVACVYGFTPVVEQFCAKPDDDGYVSSDEDSGSSQHRDGGKRLNIWQTHKNEEDMTGLHVACKFDHLDTVEYLISPDRGELSAEFRARDKNGKTALHHAVENTRQVSLVQLVRPRIKILDGPLLCSAMRNPWCGPGLVRLLIQGRPGEGYRKLKDESCKSLEVAITAINFPFATPDLLDHLVDRSQLVQAIRGSASRQDGPQVEWSSRKKVWDWLLKPLERRPLDRNFAGAINDAAISAAKVGDSDLLLYLLRVGKKKVAFNIRRILVAGVESRCRPQHVVNTVMDNSPEPVIVDGSIIVAALNNLTTGRTLMEKLLKHLARGVRWGSHDLHSLMKAAAKHTELGAGTIRELDLWKEDIQHVQIEDVLPIAIAKCNLEMVQLLMEWCTHGYFPLCSRCIFFRGIATLFTLNNTETAAPARASENLLLLPRTMLEPESPEDQWDDVVHECLQRVLLNGTANRCPQCRRMEGMIRFEQQQHLKRIFKELGPKGRSLLLDTFPDIFVISEEMVIEATTNRTFGHVLLPLLKARTENKHLFQQQSVLIAAAEGGNIHTIRFLVGNEACEDCSLQFRMAAARNEDASVIRFIYQAVPEDQIGLDEIEMAAHNSDTALEYLLGRRENLSDRHIPSNTLAKAIAGSCRRSKNLYDALEKGVAVEPSTKADVEELLRSAAANPHGLEMARFLLKRYRWTDKRVKISSELLKAAASNRSFAPEMLRLFLNECEDSDVNSIITDDVIKAAADNGREGQEALRILNMERHG
ncbi:hypothetical protein QBC44DRAFT_94942 [Cladorrhinum sp. PSN332]|nr:hypothetical protein QBC44DRAFT_94942 [Cladorrhinum sp. PSN332]